MVSVRRLGLRGNNSNKNLGKGVSEGVSIEKRHSEECLLSL